MKFIFSSALIARVFVSCNGAASSSDWNTHADTSASAPVETNKANTDYKPAFEGRQEQRSEDCHTL